MSLLVLYSCKHLSEAQTTDDDHISADEHCTMDLFTKQLMFLVRGWNCTVWQHGWKKWAKKTSTTQHENTAKSHKNGERWTMALHSCFLFSWFYFYWLFSTQFRDASAPPSGLEVQRCLLKSPFATPSSKILFFFCFFGLHIERLILNKDADNLKKYFVIFIVIDFTALWNKNSSGALLHLQLMHIFIEFLSSWTFIFMEQPHSMAQRMTTNNITNKQTTVFVCEYNLLTVTNAELLLKCWFGWWGEGKKSRPKHVQLWREGRVPEIKDERRRRAESGDGKTNANTERNEEIKSKRSRGGERNQQSSFYKRAAGSDEALQRSMKRASIIQQLWIMGHHAEADVQDQRKRGRPAAFTPRGTFQRLKSSSAWHNSTGPVLEIDIYLSTCVCIFPLDWNAAWRLLNAFPTILIIPNRTWQM